MGLQHCFVKWQSDGHKIFVMGKKEREPPGLRLKVHVYFLFLPKAPVFPEWTAAGVTESGKRSNKLGLALLKSVNSAGWHWREPGKIDDLGRALEFSDHIGKCCRYNFQRLPSTLCFWNKFNIPPKPLHCKQYKKSKQANQKLFHLYLFSINMPHSSLKYKLSLAPTRVGRFTSKCISKHLFHLM